MGLKPRQPSQPHTLETHAIFLNVDLELEGPSNLAPLVRALGNVHVLHTTTEAPFAANLELVSGPLGLEDTLRGLLALAEKLDGFAQDLWNGCTKRKFDIGLQAGLEPPFSQYVLSSSLLKRMGALGVDVVVTLYGAKIRT